MALLFVDFPSQTQGSLATTTQGMQLFWIVRLTLGSNGYKKPSIFISPGINQG